eukprot:7702461-Pyramimonas_sp.AAC.1
MSDDDDEDEDGDGDDDDDADEDDDNGHLVGGRRIMMEMVTRMLSLAAVLPSENHCLRSLLKMSE